MPDCVPENPMLALAAPDWFPLSSLLILVLEQRTELVELTLKNPVLLYRSDEKLTHILQFLDSVIENLNRYVQLGVRCRGLHGRNFSRGDAVDLLTLDTNKMC